MLLICEPSFSALHSGTGLLIVVTPVATSLVGNILYFMRKYFVLLFHLVLIIYHLFI
jgi:hypothetical protein